MQQDSKKTANRKSLSRSITAGCILFIVVLCVVLGLASRVNYKRMLYQRYESFIADILHYVDRHIDDDDLVRCIQTLERSEKYDELELFMDSIKEDFSIHYLYIIKPLNTDDTKCIMSVVSAENYYDRYVDTDGNLYLGWISDDEFDSDTARKFFNIMNQKKVIFFEETTEWGTDYTGAMGLFDSNNKPYAVLAVDVDITEIKTLIHQRSLEAAEIIILLGVFFISVFLFWVLKNITNPIALLEKSVVDFAKRSHGQRDVSALHFEAPKITTNNEIGSLSDAVASMTEDMRAYVTDMLSLEKQADDMKKKASQMSELANKDALTGVRNKTAYDKEIIRMEYALSVGKQTAFGIGMIDLNFLKRINDTYGHEQGDYAIKKLCRVVCATFVHSPVFRIGGDEFVVILEGSDYENVQTLSAELKQKMQSMEEDTNLEPWEKVSASVGFAFYDKDQDTSVLNVFRRADAEMYACKKNMKAMREG